MPIPRRDESETRQADARLLEYMAKRRLEQGRQRRQLILLGATAAAALILLTLTAASVLFDRLPRTKPQPATVASTPPVPTAPVVRPPVRGIDAPSAPAPSASTRAVAPERSLSLPIQLPEPAASISAISPPGPALEPQTDPDPARRTASWLVQNYGRLEAENRALVVAEFYSGEQRAFWQRVVTEVRGLGDR